MRDQVMSHKSLELNCILGKEHILAVFLIGLGVSHGNRKANLISKLLESCPL